MKPFFKPFFLISFLLFSNFYVSAKNNDNGMQELVSFLTSVNVFLYNTAEENKNYSPADFNNFIQEHYGDRESFSLAIEAVQKLLNDNARLLGVSTEAEGDLNAIFNHILLTKGERLERFEGLESGQTACHYDFIKNHQQCLVNAVMDGMFERINASVGSSFFNCQSEASTRFFDCIN